MTIIQFQSTWWK